VTMLYPRWNRDAHWPAAIGVASPRLEGAPGPTHEGRRRVRWLSTNGVAETAERVGDGLPESRREAAVGRGQEEREGPPFIAVHHVEQCGLVEGGDSSVRWQSSRASVRSRDAEAQWQLAP
jgi:hypothetical protein